MPTTTKLSTALEGRYVIERELGQGGMATVYLAADLKHKRKVAVKVLRPELAAMLGGERFVQEITTTAALQHPHILPLFDSGAADGFLYYVMPFIEGETLRERLNRDHQLGISDAVRIAVEVADALDYAHRHGVIHRDIKPENILLHDGRPMVADFGIALALSAAAGGRMTETGMSLGTPHYMSPEQATAEKEITARSDVYSLASVLYEMLAGEPPHSGGSAQQVIMKIITEEARPVSELRRSVPANVVAALAKALERLPADRFESAKAFAEAIQNPGFSVALSPGHATRGLASAGGAGAWWRDWRPWTAAVVLLAVGAVAGRMAAPRASDPPVARFEIPLTAEHSVTPAPVNTVAMSPDGRTIVYVGRAGVEGFQLLERRTDEIGDFHPIPGTQGAGFPVFSPDGSHLVYTAAGKIMVLSMPYAGGMPVPVADAPVLNAVLWLDNRTLVTSTVAGAIDRIGLDGKVSVVAQPERRAGEGNLWAMAALPDRRTLLVVASEGTNTTGPIVAVDTRSGRHTVVLTTPANWAWYANGHLLWTQTDGALVAAPFDARRLRITGPAATLAAGVRLAIGSGGQVAASAAGSLIYVPEQPADLVALDRTGRREVWASDYRFHSPRFSPDGNRVALDFIKDGSRDVWTFDPRQKTLTRLSFEHDAHDPVWSRDGRWLYFVHGDGVWRRRADGGGIADSVWPDGSALEAERDGSVFLSSGVTGGSFDIGLLSAAAPRKVTTILGSPYNEEAATLSPDGRRLAYSSDETGRFEVYVRPYPEGDAKILVSRGGGSEPRWAPNGRTLYYQGQKDGVAYMMAVAIAPGSASTVTDRTPLFDVSEYEPAEPHANWDISPDGQRFVMVHQGSLTELVYLQDWPKLVRQQGTAAAR